MNEKGKTLSWQEVVISIAGMFCLLGVALIAGIVFKIDGKLLLTVAIIIACLANTDILKVIVAYLPKYLKNNK